MINKIYFIIALFLCYSCTSNPKKICIEDAPLMINIIPEQDTLVLSSIFKSCKKIEISNKYLTNIVNVELIDSNIVIQSRSENGDIHVFDKRGNFIRSLVRYGRGPGEVLNIQSMCYNKYLKTIDILCDFGMCIYQCSIDGSRTKKITLPKKTIFSVNDIEIVDNNKYILYKTWGNLDCQEYKLYIYDYNKNIILNHYIPFIRDREEKISIGQKNNLYINKGMIYFYETFQNGIYEYDGENIVPKVGFKKNSYTYPVRTIDKIKSDRELIKNCIESPYIWAHINCIQNSNKIYSFFTYKKEVYFNIIFLNEGRSKTYKYIHDDLLTNKTFSASMFNVINSSKEKLICNFWSSDIVDDSKSYILIYDDK